MRRVDTENIYLRVIGTLILTTSSSPHCSKADLKLIHDLKSKVFIPLVNVLMANFKLMVMKSLDAKLRAKKFLEESLWISQD